MKSVISLIVAVSENNIIGKNNQLLWHLPADLMYFKEKTNGKPVIMGRKTFDSILSSLGKPLPNRQNIVLTQDSSFFYEGVLSAHCLNDAIQLVKDSPEVMIIGGGSVYQQALPIADKIYLTRIHHAFEGDVSFPELEETWHKTKEEKHLADEKNQYDYTFIIYTST